MAGFVGSSAGLTEEGDRGFPFSFSSYGSCGTELLRSSFVVFSEVLSLAVLTGESLPFGLNWCGSVNKRKIYSVCLG